jgi:putative ABC transport system permease protein
MLTSYLKIALRYLAKNKLYSFINMAGLSVSLACAMLMILYTKDEWSFDKFHQDVDAIHLIAIDVRNPDGSSQDKMGVTSIFHGPKFQDNLPEVQSFVRLNRTYRDIKLGEEVYSQLIMQADPEFFTFFTFPLLRGNPQTALQQPRSVVISQEIAVRHFGTEDALNKTILFEKDGAFIPYTVTGVAKRSPKNSSIQFEMVLPLDIPVEEMQSAYNWVNINMNTFVKLHPGSNAQAVESKMQQVFESESKEAMEQVRSYGFSQSFYHQLQPLAGIHLSQEFRAEVGLVNASNPVYSYILSGIALFVLALACINFVNLTIARSARRAKEIGIRKVVGGGKRELIWQFLGESFLLCCFAFMAALLFAQLLLPVFNNLVDKQLSLSYLLDARLIILYSALLILTGVLAGFYPALVLSSFSPVQTLYKRFRLSGDNYLQKSLIVFQFALATVMIIATMTIYLQFDHLTTKELGYTPDDVVQVKKRNLSPREAQVFGEELAKNPNILSVSPHLHWMMNGKINGDSIRNFYYETVDENFFDLMTFLRNFLPILRMP